MVRRKKSENDDDFFFFFEREDEEKDEKNKVKMKKMKKTALTKLCIVQEIKNNDVDSCKSCTKTCAKGYMDLKNLLPLMIFNGVLRTFYLILWKFM